MVRIESSSQHMSSARGHGVRGGPDAERDEAWSLSGLLAATSLVLIPLGTFADVGLGSLAIPLPYAVAPLLFLDAFARLLSRLPSRTAILGSIGPAGPWLISLTAVTTVVSHTMSGPALLSAANFIVGTSMGAIIGATWSRCRRALGFVSLGVCFFAFVSCLQLFRILLTSGSVSTFHQNATLPWGGSNFVAGVLVVCGFLILSKKPLGSLMSPLLSLFVLLSAGLTLSRGALLAGGVGSAAYFWTVGRRKSTRLILRFACLAVPFIAFYLLAHITALRSTGGYDPSQNTDARFVIYRVAWSEFVDHPALGTGWTGLTEALPSGLPASFAHNVVLSYLQIGGLIGLMILLLLLRLNLEAWTDHSVRAPLAAAATISMTDPFYEGFVGALIIMAILVSTIASRRRDYSSAEAVIAEPSARKVHPRPSGQPSRLRSLSTQF